MPGRMRKGGGQHSPKPPTKQRGRGGNHGKNSNSLAARDKEDFTQLVSRAIEQQGSGEGICKESEQLAACEAVQ